MSDIYDTYGDQYDGSLVGDEACCCGDESVEVVDAAETWTPVADDVVAEPVYEVDVPLAETPVAVAYEPVAVAYEPVAYEPVADVTYEPMATPAPVVSFAPMPAPAPVVDPAAAIISGSGTIGGADPYGGMTIVDAAGNVVDPAALAPNPGVIGPSAPVFGHGFEMVPDPNAPTYANPVPRVPIYPTEDDSINDIAVRNATTMAALNSLARSQDPNR